jgi:hypothetical protein
MAKHKTIRSILNMKKAITITIIVLFIFSIFTFLIYKNYFQKEYYGNISPSECSSKGGSVENTKECGFSKKMIGTVDGYFWCHCLCCK